MLDDAGEPGTVEVSVISVTEDEVTVELACEDQTTFKEVTEEDIVENSVSSLGCGVAASSSSLVVRTLVSSTGDSAKGGRIATG